jgi:hypothetical protein
MRAKDQRNITLTDEQQKMVIEYKDKMKQADLAKFIGVPYVRLKNNLTVMGLTKRRGKTEISKAGVFDWEHFKKTDFIFCD